MKRRWRAAVAGTLVLAVTQVAVPVRALAATGSAGICTEPVQSVDGMNVQGQRVAPNRFLFRITGTVHTVQTCVSEDVSHHTTITLVPGPTYLTEGLGGPGVSLRDAVLAGRDPVDLNAMAPVLIDAAQRPGDRITLPEVEAQKFSIFESTINESRFIREAVARVSYAYEATKFTVGAAWDVWKAYGRENDGRFMTLEDRQKAWAEAGIYDKYNATQIKFINEKIIPVVKAAKAAEGILGAVAIGVGYASLAAGALALAGITAPVWVVAAGIGVVAAGVAALTVGLNVARHRRGEDMITSPGAALLAEGAAAGAYALGLTARGAPGTRSLGPLWRYELGKRELGKAAELLGKGAVQDAKVLASAGAKRLAGFAGRNLVGVVGDLALGDAVSGLLVAENLGTIPLPEGTVTATKDTQPKSTKTDSQQFDSTRSVKMQYRLTKPE